jgi:pyruvate-formate lyase-activating enzyme
VWTELLVRLTARCNQACPFCSAPPPHPDADQASLWAWLEGALPRHPNPCVTLTGGEPTLWPGLPALVERLLAHPAVRAVKVQSNAVGLADARRLAAYRPHPRLAFFVSLHGATPEVYDACTGSAGQLEAARRGIEGLVAAGHQVTLNLVATRHNLDHLQAWVDDLAAWLGPSPWLRLHFSVMTCPEHRGTAPDLLVRYREAVPGLLEAARRARAAGLACDALLDSSHAAVPPCLLPAEERSRGDRGDGRVARPLHGDVEGAPRGSPPGWTKAPACGRCAEDAWCLGLPRPYVERFGLGELSPIGPGGSPQP